MNFELVYTILDWLQAHPVIAILIVFLTALTESLALIGLIVPGAMLMVIFGALIATGHFSFLDVFIAASVGAVLGDGISYWLGKYYQQQLTNLWPLNRHPQLMEKGITFFQKHGGKSILFGRFIGPIRPVIPAIAGMMNMPFTHFTIINIVSALLWAPLYLLPGILIGTSLELASELAGRFAILLLFLLFTLWLTYKIIGVSYTRIVSHTDRWLFVAMNWNRKHPVMGNVTSSIIDPHHREVRGLTLLIVILLISSLVTALLFTYALKTGLLQNFNLLVLNTAGTLQSPPFDWLLQWFSRIGERSFLILVVVIFSSWLAWQRNWVSITYLLSALLVPMGIIVLLNRLLDWTKLLTKSPGLSDSMSDFFLPSGHSALSLCVYGFIAVILARRFSTTARFTIYTGVAWLVIIIGFTRIYFATHFLSDVIAGFLLGLAWLCIIAIAYRQHNRDASLKIHKPVLVSMLLIILAASYPYHPTDKTGQDIPFQQYYIMTHQAWQESGWQAAAVYREDLKGKKQHPFNLQWVGQAENLSATLSAQGWQQADNNLLGLIQLFNPLASPQQLPLFPHVHDGRYDALRLYKVLPGEDKLLVLRLWKSDMLVKSGKSSLPLWVGNASFLQQKKVVLLSYLYTEGDFNTSLTRFGTFINQPPLKIKSTAVRNEKATTTSKWNGDILLMTE